MSARLFDTFRRILGRGMTQAEVDQINRALMGNLAEAAHKGARVSQRGIDLIHSFESLVLSTYRDPGPTGLPITGGWGSTRDENNRPFQLGRTEPKAYWDALFARDLAMFEDGVNLLVGTAPTTQNQFDALVSFAYNVGLDIDDDTIAEGLGDSTLLKKHLRGDHAGAAAEFAKWNKAKGRVLRGLTRRRAAEAALYLGKVA
jgi:lysozyme